MDIEAIAKVCHEANRAYCQGIGDDSQPTWDTASDWQKESSVNGVKFHLENPTASASDSHAYWLKEKREQGWKYGPVKSREKKEHPCCMPFAYLSREHRAKDYLFKSIVAALRSFMEKA